MKEHNIVARARSENAKLNEFEEEEEKRPQLVNQSSQKTGATNSVEPTEESKDLSQSSAGASALPNDKIAKHKRLSSNNTRYDKRISTM